MARTLKVEVVKVVRTVADIPREAWKEIRREFSTVRFDGEVPDTYGTVQIGREIPVSEWHPGVSRILISCGCVVRQ